MKAFTAIALALVISSVVYINKMNQRPEEYHIRLAKIAQEINSMNTSWKASSNLRFAKMDLEAIKRTMGTYLNDPNHATLPKAEFPAGVSAPDSFDSRTQWANCGSIKEVRDQSACGSCWAFGAVEAMSDRICIASGQKDQTRISSTDLLSCCFFCGNGCQGGYPSAAWQYFHRTGIVTGDLYDDKKYCKPYPFAPCAHHIPPTDEYPACPHNIEPTPSCKKTCSSESGRTYSDDKRKGKSVYSVTGENQMKNEVSTNGPFEVAFSVYEDFLAYKSGVYTHKTGQMLGGHAVKLIGYGTEDNTPYWLIANSWNPSWGDNGFFKIRRGVDECGIESQGVAGSV